MAARYLVTGGSGFIGRYLCRELLEIGAEVRVLDALIDQVHGGRAAPIEGVEVIRADMREAPAVRAALDGVDGVFHLAAEVGVGQSMDEIDRYVGANDLGTAVLLQAMIANPMRRIVVASSMSVYGEGSGVRAAASPSSSPRPTRSMAGSTTLRSWTLRTVAARLIQRSQPAGSRRIGRSISARPTAVRKASPTMAAIGFSPPTRVFEAAGVGACLITDAWPGLDGFLKDGSEVLVIRDGRDLVALLPDLTDETAAAIGRRALTRVLAEHTYGRRAAEIDRILRALVGARRGEVAA